MNACACSTWAPTITLVKPFALAEFEARVRARCAAPPARAPPSCARPPAPGRARPPPVDEQLLELTAREFGLLASRPDRITNRAQLVEALCNWDQELTDNGLDIAIHRLRRKPHRQRGHRTVREVGLSGGERLMRDGRMRRPSLRRRLLLLLLLPMLILLTIDVAVVTYGVALNYSNRVHDADLEDDVRTLAQMFRQYVSGDLPAEARFQVLFDSIKPCRTLVIRQWNQRADARHC